MLQKFIYACSNDFSNMLDKQPRFHIPYAQRFHTFVSLVYGEPLTNLVCNCGNLTLAKLSLRLGACLKATRGCSLYTVVSFRGI